jgi:lactate dehydrogenase-like 2-hydroxyacid dehydrogenase
MLQIITFIKSNRYYPFFSARSNSIGQKVFLHFIIHRQKSLIYSDGWKTWSPYYMCGKTLVDSVVGIYGLGKIGANIAEKLLPFNPRKIIYHNRHKLDSKQFLQ